ncbi:MAG TPA: caspase family protein [Polyangiaceae bacterium]
MKERVVVPRGFPWRWLLLFWSAVACCFPTPARAAPPAPERVLYTIAVGQNEAPAEFASQDGGLSKLRYADDDAVQLYSLLRPTSKQAFLLTVPDAETQARIPGAARAAVAPTLAALERTVERVNEAMLQDRAAGREPVLVFFFSGHGVRQTNGAAALALFDGTLTRDWLYAKVLSRLRARHVHLIIDACHAAAVVRSRDLDATLEPLTPAEVATYVAQSTLDRFPHVGAILASSASAQSFEWDVYRGGVFAHELLSGLRGAADVNADGRIEYSELAAFFSAANLHVDDPRARLEVVVQPPRSDLRAPVFEHRRSSSAFRLVGRGEGVWAGAFYVESESGLRLVDAFPEKGANLRLLLPASERLYVVSGDREAVLSGAPGSEVALASLKPQPARHRARGSVDAALRRGLFGTRYGPAFYLGFTSQREGFVPVAFAADAEPRSPAEPAPNARSDRKASGWRGPVATGLLAGAAVATIATVVFTGLALEARSDYEDARYERPAEDARNRHNRYQAVAWTSLGAALTLGGTGAALLLWPEPPRRDARSPARPLSLVPSGVVVRGQF